MKFKDFCDEKSIVDQERDQFRDFVNSDIGFPEGTNVDEEDIDAEDLEDMLTDFRDSDD